MPDTSIIVRVAWTFDDGPFPCTKELIDQLHNRNITGATWFVARHRVWKANYFECLYQLQQTGHEIGIHEIHPSEDAVNWFPQSSNCFPTIREAIDVLKEYCDELHAHNIIPRFVRLPGGELSELLHYLQILNCPVNERRKIATAIIDRKPVPVQYMAAKEDFDYLLSSLNQLNLKIWSGAPKGYQLLGGGALLPYNSWQAECAGISKGRGADNITFHQATERRLAGITETNPGIFEQKVQAALTTGRSQSVVVLAHDRLAQDITEILEDIDTMKDYCTKNNVDIDFCTMSQLYDTIR